MKNSFLRYLLLASLFLTSVAFRGAPELELEDLRIAFMADVHLQDVYGEFRDSDYRGVQNPGNGRYATIRTMEAQLHSTRLFNENYFAFLAALDDVASRGVKYVVLPGDFSDDGQPVNIRGLKRILDYYSETHGIQFLATTGNHDPVRPFSRDAGKQDFLGEGGMPQPVVSSKELVHAVPPGKLPAVISKDIQQLGYLEIVSMLGDYGFFPKEEHFYWETPFSNYDPENYQFNQAMDQASLEKRNYPVPPQNFLIPDVSYLVEPVKGLWLLALDANVYIPKGGGHPDQKHPKTFSGAGIGYNNVLSHKKHLIDWVEKVARRADQLNKTLIAFSHYPMVEFNDDASSLLKDLLGPRAMQLYRVPQEEVAQIFANAGIKLHFGGHMHINDTGIRRTSDGKTLVNVQIPSLAAYIPAYKLLTIKGKEMVEVETIVIDSVPRFKEMFSLYEQEHTHLKNIGSPHLWDKRILSTSSYREFTSWHLKELVRMRLLPSEWPLDFRTALLDLSGKELMILSHANQINEATCTITTGGWTPAQFEEWTGFDLIYDFYRLRNADHLAIQDIGPERIDQYRLLFDSLFASGIDQNTKEKSFIGNLQELAIIFQKFLNGAPSDHFLIHLNSGVVKDLTELSNLP